jgi:hypothetical protein
MTPYAPAYEAEINTARPPHPAASLHYREFRPAIPLFSIHSYTRTYDTAIGITPIADNQTENES